jgi:hypothetical protein
MIPSVKSMKVGKTTPVTCCIQSTLNVHFQIPENVHGGLTDTQIKQLQELKAEFWKQSDPACPSNIGPHVGMSCGMRLLGHLLFLKANNKKEEEEEKKE